jgi:hypothetical protein
MTTIKEILEIPDQSFPIDQVKNILSLCNQIGTIENYSVNYLENESERFLVLTQEFEIVAFVGFESKINDTVWQIKNIQSYCAGKLLSAKLIQFTLKTLRKSVQSDLEQTSSAKHMWLNSLPSLGLHPKIFDNKTEYILDKDVNPSAYNSALSKMYDSAEYKRYTWILDKDDYYSSQSVLKENQLLMPLTGKWAIN